VQGQGRDKEEKDNHYPNVGKKVQSQCAQIFVVDLKAFHEPWGIGVPQRQRHKPVEKSEEDANHKSAEENVSYENNLFAFHDSLVIRMVEGMRVYQILTNLHELVKSLYQLTACESAK
jgi:hypothetical protein